VYQPDEDLHKTAQAEQEHLRQAFERVQSDRAKSPLYAARFGEIKDDLLPTQLETRLAAQAALPGSVKNMIASVKILTGTRGPDLIFHAPVRTQTCISSEDITIEKDAEKDCHGR
jgi:hypothetical protein